MKYIDPLGDSSIIKDLTNNIVKKVELKIDEIFEKGGMKTLIERGEIQSEIEKSAFEFQEDIDSKKTIFVGVNKFINENEIIDSGTSFKDNSEDRLQRLNIFKEKRDNKIVKESLDELINVAKTSKNLMPHLITCVENNCTLGEIIICLLYTSPSPRDMRRSRMPSSA